MLTFTVSPDTDTQGSFRSLTDAVAGIPSDCREPVTIRLAPGRYREKVSLEHPNVTLLGTGDSPADTVITYDDYANAPMPDGKKRGTFRSYTLFLHAPDLTLRNLTVENASGDSATHGQAIALYAECDRLTVDSCRLLGHQDTLFTGPLPPKEYQPDGFLGPTQSAPRSLCRQYYRNCCICGDVDFIFGSAAAYFDRCVIESLHREPGAGSDTEGYATAASTPEGQPYGYVFSRCSFVSADCAPASVYLGRPWRDFAKTVLLSCTLGAHIHPAGFHDWNKPHAHDTVFYAEYDSRYAADVRSPEPSARASFVRQLSDSDIRAYEKSAVLSGSDGWAPWLLSEEIPKIT